MAKKTKMEAKVSVTPVEAKVRKPGRVLRVAQSAELLNQTDNPWTEIPKFKTATRDKDEYRKAIDHCRFFYRVEPLVSTVIDKLIEIGINDITFSKNKLSDNEFRVFTAIKPKLVEFAEQMAQEFLISGLVVPEIGYNKVDKDFIFSLGIKKYTSLELPDSLWVRDPKTIDIYTTMLADKPSYFVELPRDLIAFVKNKGKYPNGREDKVLYELLLKYYADFIAEIEKGKTEILLENDQIFRRRYTSDNPYPIPYINSALEALHHKRKLRRMDYSIIDKVISSIMHVKLGSDLFPINDTDEDDEYVTDIRNQLRMRGTTSSTLERVFQLITNHTVDISWIFPNTEALLDVEKYRDINEEILFGLGFPRVLITGEALRTGTSDPEIATLSPIKTAEHFRRKILEVIKDICTEISKRNGFKSVPEVQFKAMNLHKFTDILEGLTKLYDYSAISRTTLGEEFGYDFDTEVQKLEREQKELKKRGLPEFGSSPNSKNSFLQEGDNPDGGKSKEKVGDDVENQEETDSSE